MPSEFEWSWQILHKVNTTTGAAAPVHTLLSDTVFLSSGTLFLWYRISETPKSLPL